MKNKQDNQNPGVQSPGAQSEDIKKISNIKEILKSISGPILGPVLDNINLKDAGKWGLITSLPFAGIAGLSAAKIKRKNETPAERRARILRSMLGWGAAGAAVGAAGSVGADLLGMKPSLSAEEITMSPVERAAYLARLNETTKTVRSTSVAPLGLSSRVTVPVSPDAPDHTTAISFSEFLDKSLSNTAFLSIFGNYLGDLINWADIKKKIPEYIKKQFNQKVDAGELFVAPKSNMPTFTKGFQSAAHIITNNPGISDSEVIRELKKTFPFVEDNRLAVEVKKVRQFQKSFGGFQRLSPPTIDRFESPAGKTLKKISVGTGVTTGILDAFNRWFDPFGVNAKRNLVHEKSKQDTVALLSQFPNILERIKIPEERDKAIRIFNSHVYHGNLHKAVDFMNMLKRYY